MRRLLGTLLLALALTPAARADSNLIVGIVDDQLKWTAHPRPTTQILRDLGIGALRVPLTWKLARCYDALHQLCPRVNVMTDTSPRGNDNAFAVSNSGHSPGIFVQRMGEAYRASGRTRPLFDNIGHHPYGDFSLESPFARHPNTTSIGQGDVDMLIAAYANAFAGSDQLPIGVGGVRSSLAGWQSGLLWADGTIKPAYYGFRAVIREVARAVNCAALRRKEAETLAGGFVVLPPRSP